RERGDVCLGRKGDSRGADHGGRSEEGGAAAIAGGFVADAAVFGGRAAGGDQPELSVGSGDGDDCDSGGEGRSGFRQGGVAGWAARRAVKEVSSRVVFITPVS